MIDITEQMRNLPPYPPEGIKHCDDYIEDEGQPECLRKFLHYGRLAASLKMAGASSEDVERAKKYISKDLHQYIWSDPIPVLLADYKGTRVRVVMASRLGDVGITKILKDENGYTDRVFVQELSNFGGA